ncbi:MAG TPA: S53 family peptidase [Acidimicrobiales bacterium]|nr:S53 family peptidase [Acidimicrobiales bacterium]
MTDRQIVTRRSALIAAPVLAAGTMLGLAGLGAGGAAASASTSFAPTATKAIALQGATLIGPLAASTPLSITVGLALQNQSALESFVAGAANPSSAEFGDEYSETDFTSEYGPTQSNADAVASYLSSEGFGDVTVSTNRILVTADGTAAEAEAAFDTSLAQYSLDGADVYVNTAAAMVPSDLSGIVVGVLGLNDAFQFSATPVKAQPTASTSLPNYPAVYSPEGFWQAYQASGEPTGSRTAIATFSEGDMTQPIDNLRAEEKANDLPQVPVTVEYAGIASPDNSGEIEWDLDSQFASGMADDVSHYYFYDATTLTDSDLARAFNLYASQDIVKAASASLGECEVEAYLDGSTVIDDEIFAEAAAQGQTTFASTGDTGASCPVEDTNGVPDSGPPMVQYPASSPYVVAVGGTTLLTNSDGSYDEELAWYAGGGGLSQFEYSPYWQQQVMPVTSGETGDRSTPDMAMDADPESGANVYSADSGGFEGVGGTSLSAPLALGVWARIESEFGNRLGYAAPVLYAVYLAGSCNEDTTTLEQICTTPALHAPVAGDNGLYPETPGYNMATGLGTFDTSAMMTAIKPFVPAKTTTR